MPFVTAETWANRLDCGQSFPSVSLSSGLPAVDCRGWGGHAARIKLGNVALTCREVADGFQFDVTGKRRIVFQKRASLTFPSGEIWTPEGGLTYCELTVDQKLAVADKDAGNYVIPLTLELAPGVALLHQPALTPAELAAGLIRPQWVVGSYAVYRTTDGCKIGHIPRPFVVDSKGTTVWGSFRWLSGVLAKVFPVAQVDALVPPLRIDDTFGYETAGASYWGLGSGLVGAAEAYSTPASDGTLDSITARIWYGNTGGYTCGLYADSSGAPGSLVDGYATSELTGDTDDQKWYTLNFAGGSKPAITSGTQYHLGIWTNRSSYLMVDTGGAHSWFTKDGQTYSGGTMPSPFPSSPTEYSGYETSIYGTYTAGGGGGPETAGTAVVQASVAQPSVTPTYQSEQQASVSTAVAAVAQPAVTATALVEITAGIDATVAVTVLPTVDAQSASEQQAGTAVLQTAVSQPEVTATYAAEITASIDTITAGTSQPTVTGQHASEQEAGTQVLQAAVEQPTVTPDTASVAGIQVAQASVAQPSVTPTYEAEWSAVIDPMVAAASQPAVAAEWESVQQATFATVVATVVQPPVTAYAPGSFLACWAVGINQLVGV